MKFCNAKRKVWYIFARIQIVSAGFEKLKSLSQLNIDKNYILAKVRGFNDVIEDLTKCSKEGEFCLGYGTNIKPCCDGLECTGFPIKKCEVPQGRILKNQRTIILQPFFFLSIIYH